MQRIIKFFFIILLVTSCVSPSSSVTDSWFCSETTELDIYSCELKPNAYLSRIASTNSYGTYIGPIKIADGLGARPDGWGKMIFSNVENYQVKFNNGIPEEIKATFKNGNKFQGSVGRSLNWIQGSFERNDGETFEGTFSGTYESGYFYKRGKLITEKFEFEGSFYNGTNSPLNGEIKYKAGDYFNGQFNKDASRSYGEYIFKKDCEIKFVGSFLNNQMNLDEPFDLYHPNGSLGTIGNKVFVKFSNGEKVSSEISNGGLNFQKIESSIIKHDVLKNNFKKSNLSWSEVLSCDSSPKLDKEILVLDDSERFSYVEGISLSSSLSEYEFNSVLKSELDRRTGQIFLVAYKDKDISRDIIDVTNEDSTYISGRREVYNTEYDSIKFEVEDAYRRWQTAARNYSEFYCDYEENPITCSILGGSLISTRNDAEREYNDLRQKLASTPRTKIEDIYSSYYVEKLKIEASQEFTLVAAILDMDEGLLFTKEYSSSKNEIFEVINSPIADTDPNRSKLIRNSSTENEVDRWMSDEILLKKSAKDIFSELLDLKPLKRSKRELRNFISDLDLDLINKPVRRNNLQKTQTNNYELEDSIMVVSTLGGSGTAFFVSDFFLITNQHVVEDSKFITLRNQDDNSYTARVIDTDIATDLALIKTNTKGIPLVLEEDCQINRREEVFTIGHPVGYEYSTTRGIVSAIRDIPNPFYKATGIKKYIQIDAPISPGNSGGPLFNKNSKVVGVNTWGDNQGQNLNFAVHCLELKNFLEKNNISGF